MPNHYTTHVTIKGDRKVIDEFKAKHIRVPGFEDDPEAEQLDFNTVIPRPAVLEDTLSGTGEETHPQNLLAYAETGYLNWYDWSEVNWGTKWNSYELCIIEDGRQLVFTFHTAWAPPIPVLNKLMEMWPTLKFSFKGRDEFERKWERFEQAAA
jgi:hypothetical protein